MGIVNTVLESGDLLIRYPNNAVFVFNLEAVTKVSTCGARAQSHTVHTYHVVDLLKFFSLGLCRVTHPLICLETLFEF